MHAAGLRPQRQTCCTLKNNCGAPVAVRACVDVLASVLVLLAPSVGEGNHSSYGRSPNQRQQFSRNDRYYLRRTGRSQTAVSDPSWVEEAGKQQYLGPPTRRIYSIKMTAAIRKKRRLQNVSEVALPVLGCLCVLFLFTSCVIHKLVDDSNTTAGGSDRSRNNKNVIQQALRRHSHPHRQNPSSVRQRYDEEHPLSSTEILDRVQNHRLPQRIEPVAKIQANLPYDVHRCPSSIPENYPYAWNILDVLGHWNPDETNVPSTGIYQGLCVIDWNDPEQQETAHLYQKAELPFLIHNHPEVWKTAERWSHYEYVHEMVGDEGHRNEHNPDGNHMMYWKLGRHEHEPPGWKPPTDNVDLSFPDWYTKALNVDQLTDPTHSEHYYFRLNGLYQDKNGYLYDELPFFSPTEPSLFMVDPDEARGINCRFGSKGIIAETHYDMSRNMILMLNGRKRYILAHPQECPNMELYPAGHPSGRHSRINWSDPRTWHEGNFPNGQVNEVVLEAGDALYLPTFWFHFIVSLNMNYQCNARSGTTYANEKHIHACGF